MLVRNRVILALEEKREQFAGYHREVGSGFEHYQQALLGLASMSKDEIEARLAEADAEWPGAHPMPEHDHLEDVIAKFGLHWATHQEARSWARQILLDQTTLAVDGSQIPPSRDLSVPVGAVQVGWFENPHRSGDQYVKDLVFDVLGPRELATSAKESDAQNVQPTGGAFNDIQVNLRRFQLECQTIVKYVQAHAHSQPSPVCFFDGSLIASFAHHMNDAIRDTYVDAAVSMLQASEDCRVPVLGYVDTSYARDLVAMLDCMSGRAPSSYVTDGGLLRQRLQWGDRSQVYRCARDDGVLPLYGPYATRICFVYLKTTKDGSPARIEFPAWLNTDPAEQERVLNIVRAECVVGNGYPYALETADAVAVINMEDRKRFYSTFQQFANSKNIDIRYSRKALSKRTRR